MTKKSSSDTILPRMMEGGRIMSSPLTEAGIRSILGEKYKDVPIVVYPVIGSTNLAAIEYARGLKSTPVTPVVFIANEQTAGRGRLGRSFLSPAGTGIYMSILLPKSAWQGGADNIPPTLITTYSAVIMCRAIADITPLDPKIKWVNDIYIGTRKVAGILTQGVMHPESEDIDYAVMGVGINVHGETLPPEIEDIATTIERELSSANPIVRSKEAPVCAESRTTNDHRAAAPLSREALAARIIELFLDTLPHLGTPRIAEEYRRLSYLIGEDITVKRVGYEYPAHILGITDECELILRLSDGSEEILATGEVSVRKRQ